LRRGRRRRLQACHDPEHGYDSNGYDYDYDVNIASSRDRPEQYSPVGHHGSYLECRQRR
jgi:hypothetical protein